MVSWGKSPSVFQRRMESTTEDTEDTEGGKDAQVSRLRDNPQLSACGFCYSLSLSLSLSLSGSPRNQLVQLANDTLDASAIDSWVTPALQPASDDSRRDAHLTPPGPAQGADSLVSPSVGEQVQGLVGIVDQRSKAPFDADQLEVVLDGQVCAARPEPDLHLPREVPLEGALRNGRENKRLGEILSLEQPVVRPRRVSRFCDTSVPAAPRSVAFPQQSFSPRSEGSGAIGRSGAIGQRIGVCGQPGAIGQEIGVCCTPIRRRDHEPCA